MQRLCGQLGLAKGDLGRGPSMQSKLLQPAVALLLQSHHFTCHALQQEMDEVTHLWRASSGTILQNLQRHGILELTNASRGFLQKFSMQSKLSVQVGPLIIYSLQVIFEDFQFGSFHSCVAAELCLQNWTLQRPEILSNQAFSGLVVDCGFSFSHALPIFDGRLVLDGVQRVDLGGKALTNYMKELVSFR